MLPGEVLRPLPGAASMELGRSDRLPARGREDSSGRSGTRILIVDDHAVVRLGLVALFETVPHFAVVGQAGRASEALAEARRLRPDVVVMDVRLPDGDGVEACRSLRSERPEARVLMLTSYTDAEAVVGAVLAGAAGYLLKSTPPEQLIAAVEHVAAGGSLLDPSVTKAVFAWLRHLGGTTAADDPLAGLSEQERRMLPLIAEGKTNREIAADLSLSEHTVKTYVSHILQKLRVSRRSELAAMFGQRRRNPSGPPGPPDGDV